MNWRMKSPSDPIDLVLLAREGLATNVLFNALSKHFALAILVEQPPSRAQLIRSRMKRMGRVRVLGQMAFQALVALPLARISCGRMQDILREFGLSAAPPPPGAIIRVPSVNSTACHDLVRTLGPKAIVINGTRILSASTLRAFNCPVLNTHAGITPLYRGVHGAYWALVNRDPGNCGVTVHLVDEGIDTGPILRQAMVQPTAADNFSTYPVLQVAVGSSLLTGSLLEAMAGKTLARPSQGKSARWDHPTLWEYARYRWTRGVK